MQITNDTAAVVTGGASGLGQATARALALSPMRAMFCGRGPMNTRPCSSHISANSAFSLKNPYPGWIASAPVTNAAESRLRTLR